MRHRPEVELGEQLAQPLAVTLDAARFDQALGNLLSNACTAAGQRRVLVDTEQLPDGSSSASVMFSVGPWPF